MGLTVLGWTEELNRGNATCKTRGFWYVCMVQWCICKSSKTHFMHKLDLLIHHIFSAVAKATVATAEPCRKTRWRVAQPRLRQGPLRHRSAPQALAAHAGRGGGGAAASPAGGAAPRPSVRPAPRCHRGRRWKPAPLNRKLLRAPRRAEKRQELLFLLLLLVAAAPRRCAPSRNR